MKSSFRTSVQVEEIFGIALLKYFAQNCACFFFGNTAVVVM